MSPAVSIVAGGVRSPSASNTATPSDSVGEDHIDARSSASATAFPTMDGETVASQKRDPVWASPTERSVENVLLDTPFLNRDGGLRVSCGSNICEARGSIDGNASAGNKAQAADYITKMRFAERLSGINALAYESEFGADGRSFVIHLSRVTR